MCIKLFDIGAAIIALIYFYWAHLLQKKAPLPLGHTLGYRSRKSQLGEGNWHSAQIIFRSILKKHAIGICIMVVISVLFSGQTINSPIQEYPYFLWLIILGMTWVTTHKRIDKNL
jgi:hypothetical protein